MARVLPLGPFAWLRDSRTLHSFLGRQVDRTRDWSAGNADLSPVDFAHPGSTCNPAFHIEQNRFLDFLLPSLFSVSSNLSFQSTYFLKIRISNTLEFVKKEFLIRPVDSTPLTLRSRCVSKSIFMLGCENMKHTLFLLRNFLETGVPRVSHDP